MNFVRVEFSVKTSSIKLQDLEQMASVEPVDKLQERVARDVDKRLGLILREVKLLNNLPSVETIERTLLGEQLLALRTQGGNAQGASTQRIKLMEPERFKDKSGSNIL